MWEKTKFTLGKIWSGHFWYTKFGSKTPSPPAPPPSQKKPWGWGFWDRVLGLGLGGGRERAAFGNLRRLGSSDFAMGKRFEEKLYNLLQKHEVRLPTSLLVALHLLFGMQWVAFSLNERTNWANPVRDLQCAFAMTHLPFWDEGATCFAHSAGLFTIAHWTVVGLVALTALLSCALYVNPLDLRSTVAFPPLLHVNRGLILLLTEFLFVPGVRLLLEGTPARIGWPAFFIGIMALAYHVALACFARLLLADILPLNASHLDARAHGRAHVFLTFMQVPLRVRPAVRLGCPLEQHPCQPGTQAGHRTTGGAGTGGAHFMGRFRLSGRRQNVTPAKFRGCRQCSEAANGAAYCGSIVFGAQRILSSRVQWPFGLQIRLPLNGAWACT